MSYEEFLKQKAIISPVGTGLNVSDDEISPILKPHQRAVVKWAISLGRAGIFLAFELALARPHVILTTNTPWPTYRKYFPPAARVVSWTQDIMFHRETEAGNPPFFLNRGWVTRPHHRYWPIAADEIYVRAGRAEREGGNGDTDFSYVGKLPPCYPVGEVAPRVRTLCESYLALLFSREWFGSDRGEADLLLHEAEKRTGIELPGKERDHLLHHCQLMVPRFAQRARLVGYLLGRGATSLRLFGEGWDWEPKFRPYARGELKPGPDIIAAYRGTRINLHLNGDTNVHQRVFECLAVGGFLMAAALPGDAEPGGLYEFLTPGREVVMFHSLDELWALSRHYLAHEAERRRIAAAGQERVLREHTYRHRLREVVREVKGNRGQAPISKSIGSNRD